MARKPHPNLNDEYKHQFDQMLKRQQLEKEQAEHAKTIARIAKESRNAMRKGGK
jgi:hypothetical protein